MNFSILKKTAQNITKYGSAIFKATGYHNNPKTSELKHIEKKMLNPYKLR